MKSGFGVLMALLVGVLAALAGVDWIGVQAESRAREFAASHASISGWRYRLVSYDRHFFDAEAVSEISMDPLVDPASPVPMPKLSFRLAHHILHGPRPAHLAMVSVRTTPILGDEVKTLLRPVFGDAAPLTLDTEVSPGGGQRGHLFSPAATGPLTLAALPQPLQVEWGGIEGHYHVNAEGVSGDLEVLQPKTRLSGPQGSIEFDGLEMTSQGQWPAGLMAMALGAARGSLDRLHAEANGQALADLDGMVATATSTSEPAGLKVVEELSVDRIRSAGTEIRAIDVRCSLSGLDRPSISDLLTRLQTLQTSTGDRAERWDQVKALLEELAPRILAKKPQLSLDNLALQINGQPVHANARVQYVGAGTLGRFNPMTDLEAAATASAPLALVQSVVAQASSRALQIAAASGSPPTDPAGIQQLAQQQSRQSVQRMLDQKIITQQGDALSIDASLQDGVLRLNGAPFQGLGAPPPSP